MPETLDNLLAQLGRAGADRSLDGLEGSVLRRIGNTRDEATVTRALAPVRAFAVGFSVAVGIAAGGMAAATTASEPRQFSTFSSQPHLAPSTLLEDAG